MRIVIIFGFSRKLQPECWVTNAPRIELAFLNVHQWSRGLALTSNKMLLAQVQVCLFPFKKAFQMTIDFFCSGYTDRLMYVTHVF